MPRQARLDTPGTHHHIMGRGIEGTKIFKFIQTQRPLDFQALDVCMNYSGPVTALVGIMTQDFSATRWLRADDCSFSDNFQIAMDGSQYLDCSNVQFSEAFRQGWVFWLVAPVSLAELDWQSGDYELLFNQIPEGCPSGEVEIQGKCVSCSDDCIDLFPGNISAVIQCGVWQDEHCQ